MTGGGRRRDAAPCCRRGEWALRMIEPVCLWYREHRRDLPWRDSRDPYRIWVSEIMLQQTRVEAVRPYYDRFLKALPDVKALADCPEDKLLKLWEGLGYYSRARNLQKAARLLATQSSGIADDDCDNNEQREIAFPRTAAELRTLPGIGAYTAGAIASFAFDEPVPAADGNVFRIFARVSLDEREVDREAVRREMTETLSEAMRQWWQGKNKPFLPGDFNQGLMDLGATVCLPNATPRCEICPLKTMCAAHAVGRETDFPVRAKKKARRMEEKIILVIRDGERVALAKRPAKGLLAGMYEFPSLPETEEGERTGTRESAQGKKARQTAEEDVVHHIAGWLQEKGLEPLRVKELGEAKHVFSHIEWHMRGYEVRVAALEGEPQNDWILAEIAEIERNYPIPSAYRAYADHLQLQHGAQAARHKMGR